jgi:putative metalloenzyme radical SAM/SPASM domain maturase
MKTHADKSKPSDYALRKHPTKLFVETTTRCNLGCFMCVKQADGCCIPEGDLSLDLFKALEPALYSLEALILNGVGEPLLYPRLEQIIRRAKQLMPAGSWVGFQSNGLLLNEQRALALLDAGLDKICLSLDAVSPDVFRKVREGGEITAVDKALGALTKAKNALGRPEFQVGVEFVLMRSNVEELPPALDWAASRGATFALVTHALPYDAEHADEPTYEVCSREAVELFEYWQDKTGALGLDISIYPQVIWKFSRTAEEERVVDLVAEFKKDAEQKGISLDLKKLFSLDLSRLQEIEEVFAGARDVAQKHDMELKLPELMLKENRQCEFVEEGGAFVSWNGCVHPCYFLWHRYDCFASGWRQTVNPRPFGNLAEQDILEIWNSDDYRSFRESVISYDYPYCASCSLAPCDYVQTNEFEQDCHIKSEPCGSCLWCMGIFQCLR